jgi:hypothetical protein
MPIRYTHAPQHARRRRSAITPPAHRWKRDAPGVAARSTHALLRLAWSSSIYLPPLKGIAGSIRCFLGADFAVCGATRMTACSSHQRWDKHTHTGHPLPDFYLQNTCKLAVQLALVWSPIARRLPNSIQDMLLHSQWLLKQCRMLLGLHIASDSCCSGSSRGHLNARRIEDPASSQATGWAAPLCCRLWVRHGFPGLCWRIMGAKKAVSYHWFQSFSGVSAPGIQYEPWQ